MTCRERRLRVLLILLGTWPVVAAAQQVPLTGGMLTTPATAPMQPADNIPATMPTAARLYDDGHLGAATRTLLDMQASGSHAAPPRPMPGEQATASYRRYLRSFDREIPEYFDAKVHQNGAGTP
jgi:hypothetical protein